MFQCIGYDNTAYMDYMDPDVICITMDEWPLSDLLQSRVFQQTVGEWVIKVIGRFQLVYACGLSVC